jgi:hypothetical protein
MSDLPIVQPNDDNLEIKLPMYFRDLGWANGMGIVQKEINLYAISNKTISKKIIFNFNSCRWIDPLPLMSVLLEIIHAQHLGLTVIVRFPALDTANQNQLKIGPYQESPNRLLRFLAQEGFLDCLDKLNDYGIQYLSKPLEGWDIYKNLHVKPSYEDAHCIPIHFFIVPKGKDTEFVKNSVEKLLVGIDSKLVSKVALRARERLIYKLRVALQEVLHNVQEHAYETDDIPRTIVIYVRYRNGGLRLNSVGRIEYQQCLKEERKYCPKLSDDWLNVKPGCLEMFVLDRGMGMVKSFEKANIPLDHKYKFHQVLWNTFFDGRSTKPERQTLYGGLHLLHNLLIETSDYMRALEDGIWFGCSVPIIRPAEPTRLFTNDQVRIQGLAMHFRLGWKEETDHGNKWAKFNQSEKSEVWPELNLNEDECLQSFNWFKNQVVFDERFDKLQIYNGTQNDWLLWLVRPHRMKRDILSFIEDYIAPKVSASTVLIIADIPSYEAETYAAALSEYKASAKVDWPMKFSYIILSTNRWRFAAVSYQKHEQRHGFSKLEENFSKLRIPSPPIEPKPTNFRLAIVRWLKWHDSRRVWEEIDHGRSMFVPEQVVWGNDQFGHPKIIAGYLDFPQTTHNNLCVAIYRTALSRVLGILPLNETIIFPIDRLTTMVLREIYDAEIYESASNKVIIRLALGSILVSGSTIKASTSSSLNLHFFIHYNSPLRGCKPSLLFWLPKNPISNDSQSRLARIGKTAIIAPDGWKSFEVPRFNGEEKCIGARNPEKTYQDWQSTSPVIVKAGHWSYEGHHDFLTINIASAMDAAFLAKNELAGFLVSNILPFIGLNKSHIDINWHRLIESQLDKNPLNKSYNSSNYGLLVYRSHSSSELIIRKLLNILTSEGQKLALSRIFSILPTRVRWSGSSFLIPPLIREDIRAALINSENQTRSILLFDDATITGRTLHDLRAALSAIGATEIETLVIANRLRQPADGYGIEHLKYFWRLDLPEMGREGNCPLCHALDLANAFKNSLASKNAKSEIEYWILQWGETSPLNNWSGGLHPIPLEKIERKKYCYRYNREAPNKEGKYLTEIDLIRSTGLAIHIAELHAMTGRDDYCLKRSNVQEDPEIRIELAASQLFLFGNEFDLDVRIELVQMLIRDLSILDKHSPYTSLAALAAMGGLGMLDEDAKQQAVKMVQEGKIFPKENYSIKVLFAYLVSENLIYDGNDAYKIGKRLLSTSSLSLSKRFNAWFLETLSPYGNPHSGAIIKLKDTLKESIDENMEDLIQNALDSLDYLTEIITEMVCGPEKYLVRKEVLSELEDKINTLDYACSTANDILNQILSGKRPENWCEIVNKSLSDFIAAMKAIAATYFHIIPSAKEYSKERTFETKALDEVINHIDWKRASHGKYYEGKPIHTQNRNIKTSLSNEIAFDSKAGEVWIPWHLDIYKIVADLLMNAVYAENPISDPFADPWYNNQQDQADLWLCVNYKKTFIELILANASKYDSQTVFSKLKEQRWQFLKELNGSVEPVNIKQNIVGIKVCIPYAGHLKS